MEKKLDILIMLMTIAVLAACTSNHYLNRSESYRELVDSLRQEDSELTVRVDGKDYDIAHPTFYGEKVYFKNESAIRSVKIEQVEKIEIENGLNTKAVLISSFLGGAVAGGIIGANQPEHDEPSGGFRIKLISQKTGNIIAGTLMGGALGFVAGTLVDRFFRHTDSIVFIDPEDTK